MATRELVGKGVLGSVSCGVTGIVSAFMIAFRRDRRGIWDSVAGSIVVCIPTVRDARPVPQVGRHLEAAWGPSMGVRLTTDTGESVTGTGTGTGTGTVADPTQPTFGAVQIVRLGDPGRSVSKSHLEIRIDGTNVYIRDLGSTNGTTVVTADGRKSELARTPTVITLRSVLRVGDRTILVDLA